MSPRQVQVDDRQLALISKALGDPTRLQILQKIGESTTPAPTCSCVREWTGLSPATVSHHLKELDDAGLINMERSGKFVRITLRRDVWNAYVERLSKL
jgi:ArsR family transcriptional regulator, arsenate/arsenite/antimonite-responsive transcriptional repressor